MEEILVLCSSQADEDLSTVVKKRAKRRFLELKERGISADIDEIENDITERDIRDMNREFAPLKKADDAVLVDSSYMTIEEVADTIIKLFEKIR